MARQKKLKPLKDYLAPLRPRPSGSHRFDHGESVIAYMKSIAKRRAE